MNFILFLLIISIQSLRIFPTALPSLGNGGVLVSGFFFSEDLESDAFLM